MADYLTWTDSDAYLDFPAPEAKLVTYKHYYKDAHVMCPQCHGYGGLNLKLNSYPLPKGMENTAETRHKYTHFKGHCSQCNGWGYVDADSPNAACVHEMGSARNVGNCLNEYTCGKCGYKRTVDSSG